MTPELAKWLLEKLREDIKRVSDETAYESWMHSLGIIDHEPRIKFLESRSKELETLKLQLERELAP